MNIFGQIRVSGRFIAVHYCYCNEKLLAHSDTYFLRIIITSHLFPKEILLELAI